MASSSTCTRALTFCFLICLNKVWQGCWRGVALVVFHRRLRAVARHAGFFFFVFFWASGSVPCAWRWLVSTKVNYVMMCCVMMCYVLYCSTIELTLVIIVFVMIYCSTMERTLVIIVFVMIFVVQLNGHWLLLSLCWYIVVQLIFVIVMMYYSTIKPMLFIFFYVMSIIVQLHRLRSYICTHTYEYRWCNIVQWNRLRPMYGYI